MVAAASADNLDRNSSRPVSANDPCLLCGQADWCFQVFDRGSDLYKVMQSRSYLPRPFGGDSLGGGILLFSLASFTAVSIRKAARLAVGRPSESAHCSKSSKTASGSVTVTRLLTCIAISFAPSYYLSVY